MIADLRTSQAERRAHVARRRAQRAGSLAWSLLALCLGGLLFACEEPPPSSTGEGGVEAGAQGGEAGQDMSVGGGTLSGAEAGAGREPPNDDPLCEPCDLNDSATCPEGFSCQQLPPREDGSQEAPFCTRSCDERACPEEYECRALSEGGDAGGSDGEGARRCVPVADSCEPVFCNDQDGDGYGRGRDCLGLDCDDEDPEVNPGVTLDLCDGRDNNCNGEVDEGFEPAPCGEGQCGGLTSCVDGIESCEAPGAMGADERCDGVDEDCDGRVDEGYVPVSCGEGLCQVMSACVEGVTVCEPGTPAADDRDQQCDLIDSDCDGFVDEGFVGATCGVGVCQVSAQCTPAGIECNELQATGDDAECNQLDNDCDGRVDEGFVGVMSCGLGACRRLEQCSPTGVTCTEGAPLSADDDTCDGVDDNCNGIIDEGCATNTLSFELVLDEPSELTIAVRLSRGMQESEPNLQTLPSRLDLHIVVPEGLSLAPNGLSLGSAPSSLGITEPLQDRAPDPELIRLFFPFNTPGDYQAMLPGELALIRFVKAVGATAPFSFEWVEGEPYTDLNGNGVCEPSSGEPYTDLNNNGVCDANTTLSPASAREIMTLVNASLGGP